MSSPQSPDRKRSRNQEEILPPPPPVDVNVALPSSSSSKKSRKRSPSRSSHAAAVLIMAAMNGYGGDILIPAARDGHVDIVRLLLDVVDVNVQDKEGCTALMKAVTRGHENIVRALLGAGADVNKKDSDKRTALMMAASKGLLNIAKDLLRAGAKVDEKDDYDRTALFLAIIAYNIDNREAIVHELLRAGANVKIRNKGGHTALMMAVNVGMKHEAKMVIVRMLLEAGADVNDKETINEISSKERTVLTMAVDHNCHVDIVQMLLKAPGANVNVKDNQVRTPLMIAVENGHVKILKALLKAGADVNEKGFGVRTLLIDVILNMISSSPYNRRLDILQALLEGGADPNIQMVDGGTALMIAVENNCDLEGVKALLAAGANPNVHHTIIPNMYARPDVACPAGMSALMYAVRNRNMETFTELLFHGSSISSSSSSSSSSSNVPNEKQIPTDYETVRICRDYIESKESAAEAAASAACDKQAAAAAAAAVVAYFAENGLLRSAVAVSSQVAAVLREGDDREAAAAAAARAAAGLATGGDRAAVAAAVEAAAAAAAAAEAARYTDYHARISRYTQGLKWENGGARRRVRRGRLHGTRRARRRKRKRWLSYKVTNMHKVTTKLHSRKYRRK